MANLLKKELVSSETYQSFLADCHQCRQQLQQTELAFLAPPSQRSQCRYFNVEKLVNWGIDLLNYPLEILFKVVPHPEESLLRKRLKEKLSWLINYQEKIFLWKKMIQMTRGLEKQLKTVGLDRKSLIQFDKTLLKIVIPQSLERFQEKIFNYLKGEIAILKDEHSILATSDVLESIFGKYKCFSERSPLPELRQMLLLIPIFTMKLTSSVIKKALETIRVIDFEQWTVQIFGQSMLSKRKTIFSPSSSDMKTA